MDDKTLTALQASIKHWKENCVAPFEEVKIRDADYALCAEFFGPNDCTECPVRIHTGRSDCTGSPYYEVRRAYYNWRACRGPVYEQAFHVAARKELEFLQSLLPPESPDAR